MKVRLFAALREIAGSSWVDVETGAAVDTSAGSLLDALSATYGEEFERIARSGTVVVNGEPAGWARPIAAEDEVALLPPVSGGTGRGVPRRGSG